MTDFFMDAHMHFDLYKRKELVLDYIEKKHSYTIAVTNLPELYERYYLKYHDYKYIKIALGIHPELVFQYKQQFEIFKKLFNTTRYIGEIGLDFTTPNEENKNAQREVFSRIISMCNDSTDKILTIHSRRAEKECLEIMKDFSGKVIMHWYSGNLTMLREAIKRGYFFSVNHQMTFSNNGRKIIDEIPLNRILIESDAPFTRGLSANYSIEFMNDVYSYLSRTRGLSLIEIQQVIKNNFRSVLI